MTLKLAAISAIAAAIFSFLILRAPSPTWWRGWSPSEPVYADLVVRNATIFTADPSVPFAESMAVRNRRILRVGSLSSVQIVMTRCKPMAIPIDPRMHLGDSESLKFENVHRAVVGSQDLIGQSTHVLDIEGKIITPGFIDSHLHFIPGGLQMSQVELHDVRSREEFRTMVKEAASVSSSSSSGRLEAFILGPRLPRINDPPLYHLCGSGGAGQWYNGNTPKRFKRKEIGEWILGGGWNHDLWGGDMPSHSWVDDISPENPLWLSRMDGHMGLANSLALKMAGITWETTDPIGGAIIRTKDGEPTGVLVDSATKLVLSLIPEISIGKRRNALGRASQHALSRGVTTVIDVGRYYPGLSVDNVWLDFRDVYQWADSAGKLLTRVCVFFPIQTWSQLADVYLEKGRAFSEYLYLGGVKAFADGSLGSNSALFYEHYVAEPFNYGLQAMDLDWLLNITLEFDASGLQVAIHAIGDKANDLILDLYESVERLNGVRDRRFRIEHAQHLADGSAARFGRQKVIASVQPQHLMDDADTVERKIGVDRSWRGPYMFQTLLDNNAQLAFGSDWPVADINPLEAIKVAMKRIPSGWSTAWNSSECISLNNALISSTISAAYASFLENDLGSLSPGKLADFVVLSSSSWDAFVHDPEVPILATFVGGVQAYP